MVRPLCIAAIVFCSTIGFDNASAGDPCTRGSGSPTSVVRVIDGETVLLDDGREVRLVGALPPNAPGTTTKVLEALVAGRTVTLRDNHKRDRYGRTMAQMDVTTPAGHIWLQERLVGDGYARAYALPGAAGCLGPLLVAEQKARAERRGLWRDETFRVMSARNMPQLMALAGQFAIVEGRVATVSRTQRTAYVNFGDDWRRDFTASLATSAVEREAQGRARLDALHGKNVRVRGWIERRNGPMIVLGSLAEIELIEASDAANEKGPR